MGERLRRARKRLGLTQARLAERANVSVELVSRIETGKGLPSLLSFVSFARALDVSPNWLLGHEERDHGKEVGRLLDAIRALPPVRRAEIRRIAEALAHYEAR